MCIWAAVSSYFCSFFLFILLAQFCPVPIASIFMSFFFIFVFDSGQKIPLLSLKFDLVL